jgi:hypothetical protein
MMRVAAFEAVRGRVLGEIRERYPMADASSLRVPTADEIRTLARTPGWCVNGSRFDWGIAEGAIGRSISAFEQRLLRETAWHPDHSLLDVAEAVEAIDAYLAA